MVDQGSAVTDALHLPDAAPDTAEYGTVLARGTFSASGLHKRFGATHAVDDVSLVFRPGQVHCLLGENGAGKSTIGKMLGGLYAPDRGDIRLDGTRLPPGDMAAARAAGIALVFQELSLAPSLSVRDNICLGVQPRPHPLRWRGTRTEDALCRRLLADLGLQLPLDTVVSALPQAHQQLVEVAKALASGPRLVVLDEPTAMLGAYDRDRLFTTIKHLRGQGVGFVLVTHHIEEVLEIGDYVSILKDGRLVASYPVTPALTVAGITAQLTSPRAAARSATTLRAAAAMMPPTLLAIDGVATAARQESARVAVPAGGVVALYGVVGCGRERLARATIGLERLPNGVRMTLRDRAYAPSGPAQAARLGVNYLPSGRAANCVLPTLSIRENLMLRQLGGSHGLLLSSAAERRRAADQLSRFGTRFRRQDDRMTSLSGGNQQKVLLGRCLGAGGALLVLEDPTAGVDVGAKEEIHAMLRREVEAGLAVLLISSDLSETIALADTVHTMFAGRLVRAYYAPRADDQAAIVADVMGGLPQGLPREALHDHA